MASASRWRAAKYRTPRLVADWRAYPPVPPGYIHETHVLESQWDLVTACGRPVPDDWRRVGYGVVICPRCKGTRP